MANHPLTEALTTAFAALIADTVVDIAPDPDALAGDTWEVQADRWTLSCTGLPIIRAWIAIDIDIDNIADMATGIRQEISDVELAALAALNDIAGGSLHAALAQSHDPLSMALATVLGGCGSANAS